jgi:hypothetical protein
VQEDVEMKIQTQKLNIIGYLTLSALLFAFATTVHANESPEPRISTTSQGPGVQLGSVGDGTISNDELDPLISVGDRGESTRASKIRGSMAGVSQSASRAVFGEYWFYDASVELFSDDDRDGYYFGIDLSFDADTIYNVSDVYAVIYLSRDFGPWNEYAVTDDFTIFGTSGDDEYFVETELVSGYPTGDYDILIELFDAYDGTFVASFGPDETSELAYLPLEDAGRDAPASTTVVINEGGGGAFGYFGLLMLLAGTVFARACGRRC